MLLKLFKSNNPVFLIFIFLVGLLIWFTPILINTGYKIPAQNFQISFFSFIFDYEIIKTNSFVNLGLSYAVYALILMYLVRLDITYIILPVRTFLPPVIFTLLLSFSIQSNYFQPVLLSTLFFIFGLSKLFGTYKKSETVSKYFDVGLLIGISSLFYFDFSFLIVFVFVSIFALGPFSGREWFTSLFGFLTCFILYFGIYFVINGQIEIPLNIITKRFDFKLINIYSVRQIISLLIIALFSIIASFSLFLNYQTMNITTRIYFRLFLWSFLIFIGIFIIAPINPFHLFILGAVPLSFLFSYYFVSLRSQTFSEIMFTAFIIIITFFYFNNWFPIFKF